MRIDRKKAVEYVLKLAVGVGLVWLLLQKIHFGEVWFYLGRISMGYIALYVAVAFASLLISASKWRLLVRFKGFDAGIGQCFRLYLTGSFINNFFPSFIGGDTYRAYQIGKGDKRYAAAAASVVMDRLTGLLGAMALSVFFALADWPEVAHHRSLTTFVGGIALGLGAVFSLEFVARTRIWRSLAGFLPERAQAFLGALHAYWTHRRLFARVFGLALLFNLVGLGLLNAILVSALGLHIGLLDYLSVIFLISIISSIPISIGVPEWAYVVTLGFFGVGASAAVAMSLLIRALQMLISLAALPMYLKGNRSKD